MRAYAWVLGAVLTTGSVYVTGAAYLAEVSIASTGLVTQDAPRGSAVMDDAPWSGLWYGGMIEPITITARRVPPPMLVTGFSAPDSTSLRGHRTGS